MPGSSSKQNIEILKIFIEPYPEKELVERQELRKLLGFCYLNQGKIDTVLTYRFGELSWKVAEYLVLRQQLEQRQISISSATEPMIPIETEKFVETMLAAFKQLEIDLKAEGKVALT